MLLPAKTVKYIEALNREGDGFNYAKWLRRVRDEEATLAEHVSPFINSREPTPPEIDNLIDSTDRRAAFVLPRSRVVTRPATVRRPLIRTNHNTIADTPNARLRRRLEKVCDAWHEFQSNRARDGVYRYLEAVFAIVVHHKVRRRTKRLLRRAFDFASLPFDKNADPFTAVIRCTCDRSVDNKTISKWSRSLRYVAYCKVPCTRLKAFMKEAGGVNACAARYARYYGRGGR
jgi:hypothetical protein